MAIYFVTGKLGAGKSLCAVGRINDYLFDGRRVATNLDLNMEYLTESDSKITAIRLPDKPRLVDFEMLGRGHDLDRPDESQNGLIVLDECLDFLDSRSWRDPERAPVLSWLRHARKHRWDVIFLLQDHESADGQMVRQLCEHLVICRRLDRAKLGPVRLPKVHIAQVHYGETKSSPAVDRWVYRGTNLYDAYDTEQCFTDEKEHLDLNGSGELTEVDMRAPYTYLSHWHLKGRYDQPEEEKASKLKKVMAIPLAVSFVIGFYIPKLRPYFWLPEWSKT